MNAAVAAHSFVIPAERSERRDPPCSRKGGANWSAALATEGWTPAQEAGVTIELLRGGVMTSRVTRFPATVIAGLDPAIQVSRTETDADKLGSPGLATAWRPGDDDMGVAV